MLVRKTNPERAERPERPARKGRPGSLWPRPLRAQPTGRRSAPRTRHSTLASRSERGVASCTSQLRGDHESNSNHPTSAGSSTSRAAPSRRADLPRSASRARRRPPVACHGRARGRFRDPPRARRAARLHRPDALRRSALAQRPRRGRGRGPGRPAVPPGRPNGAPGPRAGGLRARAAGRDRDPSGFEPAGTASSWRGGCAAACCCPQVATEMGWDREQMLEAVCRKAGLSGSAWREKGTQLFVFESVCFGEREDAVSADGSATA